MNSPNSKGVRVPVLIGAEPFAHEGSAEAGVLLWHGFTRSMMNPSVTPPRWDAVPGVDWTSYERGALREPYGIRVPGVCG